jgi:hypothetical protein
MSKVGCPKNQVPQGRIQLSDREVIDIICDQNFRKKKDYSVVRILQYLY